MSDSTWVLCAVEQCEAPGATGSHLCGTPTNKTGAKTSRPWRGKGNVAMESVTGWLKGQWLTVEEDHRQPAEQGYPLSALKTYRYLRIGMLVVVLTLGYSVLEERLEFGLLARLHQRLLLHAGRSGLRRDDGGGPRLALVVIKGRMVEDAFLTLAGFMAPVVVFLPTTDPTLGANYPSFEAHASPGRGRSSTTALTPGQGSSPVPRGTTCTRWPLPAQSGSSWSSPPVPARRVAAATSRGPNTALCSFTGPAAQPLH